MRGDHGHRPWPRPDRPWLVHMRWCDLLFAHWPVAVCDLQPHVPGGLDVETFDGTAWLGVVPFRMENIRPRLMPPVPGLSAFPELNVRTYVTVAGKPGVWFFSLDATQPIFVRLARRAFHVPYMDAQMSCDDTGGEIIYRSTRTHRDAPPAEFAARYRPAGPPFRSTAGSIEEWLTERYCAYSVDRAGRILRTEVTHAPWPLQPAEAAIEVNTMTESLGVSLSPNPELLHFARRIDVVGWWAEPVAPVQR